MKDYLIFIVCFIDLFRGVHSSSNMHRVYFFLYHSSDDSPLKKKERKIAVAKKSTISNHLQVNVSLTQLL